MKNRFIAAFDTEDDGKGNAYLWAIVHSKGSWYSYDRNETLEYILTLARDLNVHNTILEMWATNLEYDLVNLYGEDRIRELSLRFGKSYLVGAIWKGHNTQFRDTVRHIPQSVKELGKLVGIPKLTMRKGQKENVAYCVRDAAITYRTAIWLNRLYASFNIIPKQTLASSALSIWRDNYWRKEVKLPLPEIYRNSKEAYYGGRTEAFAIGSYENVRVLDVASMFPACMIANKFPIPWGPFRRFHKGDEIEATGIYKVSIDSQIERPFLPVKTTKGTIYPNGRFTGWYCGNELQYAVERGVNVRIIKGYGFIEFDKPFDGYITEFYERKQKARGSARLGYKLLMNALYGKFGQTGDKTIAVPIENFVRMKRIPDSYRIWNGICIYPIKGEPPPWGNNIWSALITAYARIKLAREIEKISQAGGRVLYCDTDSIIFAGAEKLKYPTKAPEIGAFELRGNYSKIHIAGKKEYGLCDEKGNWEIHVKGVPMVARADYLFNGTASYSIPTRLREAARRGIKVNEWNEKTKTRKVNFDERGRKPDGTLAPIVYYDRAQ